MHYDNKIIIIIIIIIINVLLLRCILSHRASQRSLENLSFCQINALNSITK